MTKLHFIDLARVSAAGKVFASGGKRKRAVTPVDVACYFQLELTKFCERHSSTFDRERFTASCNSLIEIDN